MPLLFDLPLSAERRGRGREYKNALNASPVTKQKEYDAREARPLEDAYMDSTDS